MKNIVKKLFAGLFAAVLTLTWILELPIGVLWNAQHEIAYAANIVAEGDCGAEGDNLIWMLDEEGTLTVSGSGKMMDWDTNEIIDRPWRSYNDHIKKVKIDKGVTNIGGLAFFQCRNLAEISIPNSVTVIGFMAFGECTELTNAIIPASVEYISAHAFVGSGDYGDESNLEKVYILNSNCAFSADYINCFPSNTVIYGYKDSTAEQYVRFGNYEFVSIVDSGECGVDGDNLIWILDENDTLTISGSGKMCDWSCRGQTSTPPPWFFIWTDTPVQKVSLPNELLNIGSAAFYFQDLKSITIPDSVKRIGSDAFLHSDLEIITIPNSVTNIGADAFAGCEKLTSVTLLNSECEIYDSECTIVESAIIHGYLGSTAQAYAEKYGRTFVELPTLEIIASGECGAEGDNLTWTLDDEGTLTISGRGEMPSWSSSFAVPWSAVCKKIKEVIIQDGVTSIGSNAFFGEDIESVSIPDSVTSIGDSAFCICSALTDVTIPKNVNSIGSHAFYRCDALTEITIPDGVSSIGDQAFNNCYALKAIYVSSENTYYSAWDGVLFSKDQKVLICYPAAKIETVYMVPAAVKTVAAEAFISCMNLKQVTLPEGLVTLGKRAFWGCRALEQVNLPDSLKTIEMCTFSECNSLKNVSIGMGIICIEQAAFSATNLHELTIPENVVEIGPGAFSTFADSVNENPIFTILNPDCKFVDTTYAEEPGLEYTFPKSAVIRGYNGSTAENYAKNYNRTFEQLDFLITTSSSTLPITNMTPTTSTIANNKYKSEFYPRLSILGHKVYETEAKITNIYNSDKHVALCIIAETRDYLNVQAVNPGTCDIEVYLENGDVYAIHVTVGDGIEGTTTKTPSTPTNIATTTTTTSTTTSTTTTTTTTYTTTIFSTTTTTLITTVVSTTSRFVFAYHTWNCPNAKSVFTVNGKRYITDADYAMLDQLLSHTEMKELDRLLSTPGESCFGMSLLSWMAYAGRISPSDIWNGAGFLRDIPVKSNYPVVSVINAHQGIQVVNAIQDQIGQQIYLGDTNEEHNTLLVNMLIDKMAEGNPVLLGYAKTNRNFNHTVLAYESHRQSTVKSVKGEDVAFNLTVKIYDPNSITDNAEYYMYINTFTHNWYIPAYEMSNLIYGSMLCFVLDDLTILSQNSILTKKTGYAPDALTHPRLSLTAVGANVERVDRSAGSWYNGNPNEECIRSDIGLLEGIDSSTSQKYVLKYAEDCYRASFNEGEYEPFSAELNYGDRICGVDADALSSIVFTPEGAELEIGDRPYSVYPVRNKTALDKDLYQLSVHSNGGGAVVFSEYQSGWLLSADQPLAALNISASNINHDFEQQCTTAANKVYIFAESDNRLGVRFDFDDDGVFETELSDLEDEDVNCDGIVNMCDAVAMMRTICETPDGVYWKDVDGDGLLTILDACRILRKLALQ